MPVSSEKEIAKDGRPNRSLSRAATSPTTPGCQPSPVATTIAGGASPNRADTSAIAVSTVASLDGAALAVQAVEFGGDAGRFRGIALEQQARAERRVADPAAGIDARAERETEMPRLGRAVEPCGIRECRKAETRAARHRLEPARDERPVEAGERRDIGDRGERHQIEIFEQVWLRASVAPEILRAQVPVDCRRAP